MTDAVNFDLNYDGVVNYTDLGLAQAQGIEVSDEIREEVIENGPITVSGDTATDTNYTTYQGDPESLDELYAMITAQEALIDEYQADITLADTEIPALKERQVELEAEQAEVEAQYQANNGELKVLQNELSTNIATALLSSGDIESNQKRLVNKTVEDTVYEYTMGEYDGEELQTVIDFKLSNVGVDTSALDSLIASGDSLGTAISAKCSSVENIAGDLRTVSAELSNVQGSISVLETGRTQGVKGINTSEARIGELQGQVGEFVDEIIANYKVDATGGDKCTSDNDQVTMLQQFLDDGMLEQLDYETATTVLTSAFNSVISANGDGTLTIPKGHDDVARVTFDELDLTIQSLYGESSNRTDPIGFESNGEKFDFIVDKDSDGTFDGKEEFLGAEDGWSEMAQYDANKDGLIAGDELDEMMVLKTDENGEQSIVNASQTGLEEIDLDSYKEMNEDLSEDSTQIGSFDVKVDGQESQGYQTLDTDSYLDESYGNTYGTEMASSNATSSSSSNPFNLNGLNTSAINAKSLIELDSAKSTIAGRIQSAESMTKNYSAPTNVEEEKKEEDKEEDKQVNNNETKQVNNKETKQVNFFESSVKSDDLYKKKELAK